MGDSATLVYMDEDFEGYSDDEGSDQKIDPKSRNTDTLPTAENDRLLPGIKSSNNNIYKPDEVEVRDSSPPVKFGRCGCGRFVPQCLQRLNQFEWFILCMSLSGVCMGMQNALKSASLTRLEKRFSWDSTTVSMVTASNDMVFLPSVLIVSYIGAFGHRPKILAFSCLGNGLSALLFSLPYFIFGALLPEGPVNATASPWPVRLGYQCSSNDSSINSMGAPTVSTVESRVSLALFMISGFLEGLSAAPYWNLGVAFIDDITGDMSGVFTGIVIASRLLSPSLGYMLYGKVIMKIPENLKNYFDEYPLKLGDPTYVPAWWIGFVVVGIVALVVWVPLFMFPKEPYFNPKKYQPKNDSEGSCVMKLITKSKEQTQQKIQVKQRNEERQRQRANSIYNARHVAGFSFGDFFTSLFRIFSNPIYICLLLGNIFEFMELNAIIAYFAKYLENQYHVTAAEASSLTGIAIPGCNMLGIVISSFVASQVTMKVPQLARYHAIVNTFGIASSLVGFFFTCAPITLEYMPPVVQGNFAFPYNSCYNESSAFRHAVPPTCTSCNRLNFKPICVNDKNYYNLCSAGCVVTKGKVNCPCENSTMPMSVLGHPETCTSLCSSVYSFIALYALLKLVRLSARSQEAVLQMRCVKHRDKSLGLGFNSFAFSINGVWVPIVLGHLFDKACLILNPLSMSEKTNCLFYDTVKFRYSFIGFITAAQIPACMFFYLAWFFTIKFRSAWDEETPTEVVAAEQEEMRELNNVAA